jgi:Ca2+-binding RTX toxin-like protein
VATCLGYPATIIGMDGPDKIVAPNRLVGGPGDDRFMVRGFDMLHFEDAPGPIEYDRDRIVGDGDDRVIGSPKGVVGTPYDDRITVNLTLVVYGGSGDDYIDLSSGGADTVYAGPGDDRVFTRSGPDLLFGGSGRDVMQSGFGPDRMFGGDGPDRLIGGRGHDKIYGGSGDDYLNGYFGFDKLWGGQGRDRCLDGELLRSCTAVTRY